MQPEPPNQYRGADPVPLKALFSKPRSSPPHQGILPLGRTRVMQMVRDGEIRTIRLGKRSVFVPREEIERLLREGVTSQSA